MDASGGSGFHASDHHSFAPSERSLNLASGSGHGTEGPRLRPLRPAPAAGYSQASQSNASTGTTALLAHSLGPWSQADHVLEPEGFHQGQDPASTAIPRWAVGSQLGLNTFVPWTAGPLNQVARTVDLVNHLLQQHPSILESISSAGNSQLLQPQVDLLNEHPLSKTPGRFLAIVIPIHHQPAPAPAPAPAPTPANGECQQANANRELTDPETGQFVCPYRDGKQSTSPSELIMHLRRQHHFTQVKYTPGSGKRKAPNYIERPATSTSAWCALCTWCYEAFATGEKLSEHVQYHRSNAVKENTYTRAKKVDIIWNLVHPGRHSSFGHEHHGQSTDRAPDAPPVQADPHPACPPADGRAVPGHAGSEGASTLPDFHFMGAKFDGPDRVDPASLMSSLLDISQPEMQGIADEAGYQKRQGYVNPRDLELNRS